MARKFFGWPRLVAVVAVIIIILAVVVWYVFYNAPPTSITPTPTPTVPYSSPTLSSTPKSSSTPSNSAIPTLTATPRPTPSPSPTTPTQTTVPTPTLPASPSPSPTTIPTATPTPTPSPPITVVFSFDNATPALIARQPTPFDQTSNGVTAHFSSPSETVLRPAFSVQDLNSLASISTVVNSPKFSGLFLWPSTINRDKLDISFSVNITSISFVFKTAELHDPGPGGTGSPIRLTAYMNSISTIVSSPIAANGVETPLDTYPEGTLTFSSGGQPFNLVEIDLPSTGATGFVIDNISVITA